jgi:Hsp20/alpha crystallin family
MTPDRVIVEAIKVAQDLLRQNLPPMPNLTDAATRPFPFDTITSKIDLTKISAELQDGVLALSLPKVEEAKPRTIQVK